MGCRPAAWSRGPTSASAAAGRATSHCWADSVNRRACNSKWSLPTTLDGQVVSSSRVRAAIAEGRIDEALHLLTRPYRIAGIVVHGAARGRTLGYPTANVERIATLLPSEGIYAGRAWVDGARWPAAISLGPNPTFGEGALKVEVYLIGFDGDLVRPPARG